MKSIRTTCFLLLLSLHLSAQIPGVGNNQDLPFTLDIEEVTQDELPGLHSCAFAQWQGLWIIVGGRIGGLHGFFPITGFPENEANTNILVIDPTNGAVYQTPVDILTIPFPDQLKSTNPQYTQDGDQLFICGGYGKDAASGNFITFPVLTAIQIPALVAAVMNGANPSTAIRQIEAPNLRVCGGEMEKLGASFYLVGGHDFTGKYSDPNNGSFVQSYTNEIRKFSINSSPNSLSISNYSAFHDEQNLHRRDFTLAPIMQPDITPALCLYGGVFRPDEPLPYYHPVYISETQTVQPDEQYEQLFSQYTCPAIPLYNPADQTMYTLLFGGLSAHYVDQATQTIAFDERVPFIKDITTFRRNADGSSLEYVMPQRFDALLGTNMIFVAEETAPHYDNEVLNLSQMTGKTFVGYLFGGIKAEIPNITPSSASNRMFKVYISPKTVSSATAPETTSQPRLYPNPFTSGDRLQLESGQNIDIIELSDLSGRTWDVFKYSPEELTRRLNDLPAGAYLLKPNKGRALIALKY